ncbi:MAG TPA: alpha/beta fold hydrolase [Methylosinus sp.]
MDLPVSTLARPESFRTTHFSAMDSYRRAQGNMLEWCGFGPNECNYRIILKGPHWRLREYAGGDGRAAALIVPAPIKRPYIWDLAPSVSVVRHFLDRQFSVHLIEWMPASDDFSGAGIREYADHAISECLERVMDETSGRKPALLGHSLGGTFAAISCALQQNVGGLVLLSAPLCFQPASSSFRDALVSLLPRRLSESDIVPGSLLSQMSAFACPRVFVWEKLRNAVLCALDPSALEIGGRVERWLLDEAPLPGKLVAEIVQLLYCEDRFCRGALMIGDRIVGPSDIEVPTLAIVDTADQIAPLRSVEPFVAAIASTEARIIEYPGEADVGLQHLALLAGPLAHSRVWPEVFSWLDAHLEP